MLVQFVLVNRNFQPFGGLYVLDATSGDDDYVYGFQEKVKEARSLALARVDAARLSVRRCIKPAALDDGDHEKFRLQVRQLFSEKQVKPLSSGWRITDLQPEIMEGETFFVEVTIDNWPGANQPEHNYFENRGGVIEQLKACGYEVVPDVWDTDRGTWEPLFKLPRCMRTVYRQNDPNKTELITKPSRLGSHELDILRYLHSIDPPSPHIISFTPLRILGREWLILPKLHTLCNELLIDSRGVSGREQLGWGLVKGLAYLHEHNIAHLDIKPDNLVCDDDFRLKIIDFDIAIKVEDENTEIDEYCGTEDWTAPEVGERDSPTPPWYSPIKADRWSCGYVIWHHIMAGNGDSYLSKFAEQLMANDPQQRPSLPDWHKYLGAPFSDVSHVLKNGRPRKDMVEVDGENVKAPDAKRPRLETPSGWYCPNTTRPETDRYNVEI